MAALGENLANLCILGSGGIGIVYCWRQWRVVCAVRVHETKYKENLRVEDQKDQALLQHRKEAFEKVSRIGAAIAKGAESFLMAEFRYLVIFVLVFAVVVWIVGGLHTAIAFFFGCAASSIASFAGIKVATYSNYRTTHECLRGVAHGYALAMRAGSIAASFLVAIAVLSLFTLALVFNSVGNRSEDHASVWIDLAGYSFGVSSIALFMRVGGGIFTKAADIGADLSALVPEALCADDYRSPACIADHVGDNVGGVVGKGADLFSSFAAATCAAFYLSGSASGYDCKHGYLPSPASNWNVMMFPMMITCSGLLVNLVSLSVMAGYQRVKDAKDVEKTFKQLLLVTAVAETPVLFVLAFVSLPATFTLSCEFPSVTPLSCVICTWLGLWSGLVLAYVTEYHTSHRRLPVQQIAEAQEVSAATGIIFGLAVGYGSCAAPIVCLAVTILLAQMLVGAYGIALAALGMLTVMTMCLTIDAYDSIADNAGGISEMSGLKTDVECQITDVLGGAGAIGNGFALGVGSLVSISLLRSFLIRARVPSVDTMDMWYFTGLLLGATLPYAFSAVCLKSVGSAANEIVNECKRQFDSIIYHEKQPDYDRCINISTTASLKKLFPAGLLVIGFPIAVGFALGKKCTAGLLQGALVCGMQLAISMINTGGAFDNAKKHVSQTNTKDSSQHLNAVTGDTVGDPLKDVSGPSLNVLVNLCAITSLIFGSVIDDWSAPDGGPFWLVTFL